MAPPLPFIPEDRVGEPFLVVVSLLDRRPRRGRRGSCSGFRDVATPVAEHGRADALPGAQRAVRRARPARACSTTGRRCSSSDLTDEAIAAHLEHGPRVPVVNSTMHLYPINGACHDVAARRDGVRPPRRQLRRGDRGHVARPGGQRGQHRMGAGLLRRARAALGGGRVHQLRVRRRPASASATTTAPNYDRLAQVKRAYDPDNLFHLNQNITPAVA